jgi:uncharacterized tellurite resistance protein B-like protein
MFKGLKAFLQGTLSKDDLLATKSGMATDNELHIATAVLLVELAGRDNDIDPREAETICQMLAKQFGLS